MSALMKLLLPFLFVNSALAAVVKNEQDTGLYSFKDDVTILTVNNFNETILDSKKPWIVEFYSSWCGFCQRFAPHWKEFATEVKHWNDVVGIGVLDCANEANSMVCFQVLVTAYPTLRYFHQNYEQLSPGRIGDKVELGDRASLHKRHLIDELIKDQAAGTLRTHLNLQPFIKESVNDLFESTPVSVNYAILIIQDPTDTIGAEVALDFHQLQDVVIRYSFSNNTKLLNSLGSDRLPAMYSVDRNYTLIYLNSFTLDSEGFGRTILQYLASKNVQIPVEIINHFNKKPIAENNSEDTTDVDSVMDNLQQLGDVVLQGDMETTLRYSLKNEVGLRKVITGEKLEALRNYVDVLLHYFPFGENGKILLQKVKDYINSSDTVNGGEISKMIKAAEKPDQKVFSSPRQWLACKGSLPHTRGYPCGLWKMFHYLTVNAAKDKFYKNPRIILDTMHGYIKNFFSCEDCKNHFLQMADRRQLIRVNDWDEGILWLWAAHNEVNNRLSGDETEDPAYPKIQFPSRERCTQCHNIQDNTWNQKQVLLYLKEMYDSDKIQYLGANKEVLEAKADGTSRSSRTVVLTSM